MSETRTQFDYLLNAFEAASQSERPADHDYAAKRRALFAYVRDLESRPTPAVPERGEPQKCDSGTFGELPKNVRALYARVTGANGGHIWDNMTRLEQRTWLIEQLNSVLATPEGEDASADDLFMELSSMADAKDVEANGPNKPLHRRSLHAVTLTMNEILLALAKVQDRDCVCGHARSEHGHRKGYREGCAATLNGVDLSDGACECRGFAPTPEGEDARRLEFLEREGVTVGRLRDAWSCQRGILELGRGPTLRGAIDAAMTAASTPTRSERDG